MRLCATCGELKPLDDFTISSGSRYRKNKCKPCRAASARAAYEPRNERTCRECGERKSITDFVRIKKGGIYRRCRVCRNVKARARYWADPQERERQKARAKRNRARRAQEALLSRTEPAVSVHA